MFLEDPELVYSTAIPIFNTPPPPAPSSTTRAGPQTTFSQTYLGLGRAIKNCGPWDTSRSRLESPGKALDTDPSFPPFFFLPPRKWVGVMTRPSCNHEEKGKKFLESSSVTTSQQPPTIDLLCDRKKKMTNRVKVYQLALLLHAALLLHSLLMHCSTHMWNKYKTRTKYIANNHRGWLIMHYTHTPTTTHTHPHPTFFRDSPASKRAK